ncbi:MAG: hypothetical protein LBV29_08590 [Azoarcus sp.]|jgi:hypothetical protein|nr:hypothetical protein [Azoarcus sp.]
MHRIRLHFLALLLATASALAQTASAAERKFSLPDHGYFVIRVPSDWKDQVRQSPNRLPPTITFGPGSGKPFQVLLTTLWPATKDRPPLSRDQLRAGVERDARRVKAQAVESELPLVGFQGQSGPGFYFAATDRAPKPGEFKFLTQGVILVGELTVTFTILTNDGQELIIKQALDALKGAKQEGT